MGPSPVIMTTFAGRRDRMSILVDYAVVGLRRGIISEYHIWDYARTLEDRDWLVTLAGLHPGVRLFSPEGGRYDAFYAHYREKVYGDAVFIKSDDDILFIDLEGLREFIAYRRRDRETFLLSANVVNNGVCAYFQQKRGVVPHSLMELPYPPGGFCGALWESANLATRLHRHFLSDPGAFAGTGTTVAPDRLSINFVAYLGKDLLHFNSVRGDDEQMLSVTIPGRIARANRIYNPLVVSHLSFFSQEPGMDTAALLKLYRDLARQSLGDSALPGLEGRGSIASNAAS